MLPWLVIDRHQPRALPLPALLLNVQTCQRSHVLTSFAPNSFPLNLFADPHPLTPVPSIFYENSGGAGGTSTFRSQAVTFSPTLRPHKSFNCNTYRPPRKCCKRKTYGLAKSFRCNTYKKTGGTSFEPNILLSASRFFYVWSFKRSEVQTFSISHLPYTLPSSVSCNSFICHSYENCRGVGGFFPFWDSFDDCRRLAPTSPEGQWLFRNTVLRAHCAALLHLAPWKCMPGRSSPRSRGRQPIGAERSRLYLRSPLKTSWVH